MPNRASDAFNCPRCGVYAHQTWHVLMREQGDESGNAWTVEAFDYEVVNGHVMGDDVWNTNATPVVASTQEPIDVVVNGSWAMAECGRCREFSTWRGGRLIYPAGSSLAPQPAEDMPEDAKNLYREASEVIGISRRAGAALARATLERLLRELDPVDGKPDLAKRIKHVLPRVSSSLGEMLTIIRHAGNKSLHVDGAPDDVMVLVLDPEEEEIVGLIFAAINELVDELVTKPARVRKYFEDVPERIRLQAGNAQD